MMMAQAAHTDNHKPAVFPGGMGATVYLFFASKGMPNPWAMAGRDQDIHEQGYHTAHHDGVHNPLKAAKPEPTRKAAKDRAFVCPVQE